MELDRDKRISFPDTSLAMEKEIKSLIHIIGEKINTEDK